MLSPEAEINAGINEKIQFDPFYKNQKLDPALVLIREDLTDWINNLFELHVNAAPPDSVLSARAAAANYNPHDPIQSSSNHSDAVNTAQPISERAQPRLASSNGSIVTRGGGGMVTSADRPPPVVAQQLQHHLDSGVLLCRLIHQLYRVAQTNCTQMPIHWPATPPSYTRVATPDYGVQRANTDVWKARSNITKFLEWCRTAKFSDTILFETEGLMNHMEEKNLVLTLMEIGRQGARLGLATLPQIAVLEEQADRELLRMSGSGGGGGGAGRLGGGIHVSSSALCIPRLMTRETCEQKDENEDEVDMMSVRSEAPTLSPITSVGGGNNKAHPGNASAAQHNTQQRKLSAATISTSNKTRPTSAVGRGGGPCKAGAKAAPRKNSAGVPPSNYLKSTESANSRRYSAMQNGTQSAVATNKQRRTSTTSANHHPATNSTRGGPPEPPKNMAEDNVKVFNHSTRSTPVFTPSSSASSSSSSSHSPPPPALLPDIKSNGRTADQFNLLPCAPAGCGYGHFCPARLIACDCSTSAASAASSSVQHHTAFIVTSDTALHHHHMEAGHDQMNEAHRKHNCYDIFNVAMEENNKEESEEEESGEARFIATPRTITLATDDDLVDRVRVDEDDDEDEEEDDPLSIVAPASLPELMISFASSSSFRVASVTPGKVSRIPLLAMAPLGRPPLRRTGTAPPLHIVSEAETLPIFSATTTSSIRRSRMRVDINKRSKSASSLLLLKHKHGASARVGAPLYFCTSSMARLWRPPIVIVGARGGEDDQDDCTAFNQPLCERFQRHFYQHHPPTNINTTNFSTSSIIVTAKSASAAATTPHQTKLDDVSDCACCSRAYRHEVMRQPINSKVAHDPPACLPACHVLPFRAECRLVVVYQFWLFCVSSLFSFSLSPPPRPTSPTHMSIPVHRCLLYSDRMRLL